MKLRIHKLLPILFLATAIGFAGCEKDDFEEIVGVCPVVLSTTPANLQTNVPLNQVIAVNFNTVMDPATITTSSITLAGPSAVAGTVTYSGTTAYFTPDVNLLPFTSYTGNVATTVKDITGNALQVKYVWTFNTGAAGINLGTAGRFALLAGTGISSTGFSEINNGDLGVSPGLRSSISGFPPAIVADGAMYASNDLVPTGVAAMLTQAHQDLTDAYQFAVAATSPSNTQISGDLGGRTLTPGIYSSVSTLTIQTGQLTLDAQGDANAYWIFRTPADLTTIGGAGGNVILTGGANANNVFWQVGNSVTLGNNTTFRGNILAFNTVRMNDDATLEGRLLSLNGLAILMNTNIINKP